MTMLVIGLLLFVGMHLVLAVAPAMRERFIERFGRGLWRVLFSLVVLTGLYLIVSGYSSARMEPVWVWYPPAFLAHLAALLVLVAFVFVVASYVPGNAIKARVGHPMLVGVKTWALAHLLVNGTLADILLFGSFLAWGVIGFILHRKADRAAGLHSTGATSLPATLVTLAGGVIFTGIFALWLHPLLIGVPAILKS